MAKFYGAIGYVTKVEETSPGVYESIIEEVSCRGDLLKDNRRWDTAETLNDDIMIGNRFSIIADTNLMTMLPQIRYILWNGVKWKVTNIDVERPRLILMVRGVYNG